MDDESKPYIYSRNKTMYVMDECDLTNDKPSMWKWFIPPVYMMDE